MKPRDVAGRQRERLIRLHVDHERLARYPEPTEHLGCPLGLAIGRLELVDDDDRAVAQLLRERRANGADADLLRQRKLIAARLRPEHGATLAPQRRAARSDLRPAGALLLVRLLAAAAH